MAQPQMQFAAQGFPAGMGAVAPPAAMMGAGGMMPGMAMPNGGYVGVQQGMVPAGAGQNMYNMQQQQQGQWNMNQVTLLYKKCTVPPLKGHCHAGLWCSFFGQNSVFATDVQNETNTASLKLPLQFHLYALSYRGP